MEKRNQVDLRFCIWNFDGIAHSDISAALKLSPQKVIVKGEKRNPNNPNSPEFNFNGWILQSELGVYASFEDQMNNLLDILEPRIGILKDMCSKYTCEFSCALFIYKDNGESTPSVHLYERYNNFVKELSVEFDIDLYVL